MITAALIFAFGFLLALLLALLLAPLVWKRARSIARQEFDATIPASAGEIRGTYDQMRARTIFEARKREMLAEERENRAVAERAEAGRIANENAELTVHLKTLGEQLARQATELEDLNSVLSRREEEADEVDRELRDVNHDLRSRIEEVEELGIRFEEMRDIADERKIRIITLETRNEELAEELRSLERRSRKAADTAPRRTSFGKAQHVDTGSGVDREDTSPASIAVPLPAGDTAPGSETTQDDRPGHELPVPVSDYESLETISDPARLREEIADLAARVIDLTARREGPASPIETILAAARDMPEDARGLAGRVENLRRARERDAAE